MSGSKLKFKQLTRENWQTIDGSGLGIVRVNRLDGSSHDISTESWVETLLEPQFSHRVPNQVRELFEVARGAMLYGVFFYPLFSLGSEQIFRVLEAGLVHKAIALSAPSGLQGFKPLVEWLSARGAISPPHLLQSEAARRLRNSFSHPKEQSLMFPTDALRILEIAVELIDTLFGDS